MHALTIYGEHRRGIFDVFIVHYNTLNWSHHIITPIALVVICVTKYWDIRKFPMVINHHNYH